MDAPYLYIVKFWVHPDSLKTVKSWLDRGHRAGWWRSRGSCSCGV